MSTVSKQKPEHVPNFKNDALLVDLEILKEASSEAPSWLDDALSFFSSHQYYTDCKDELKEYFLTVFNAEEKVVGKRIQSPACLELIHKYRVNDFLLGISAMLIHQYGREKGIQLAKAFQRAWLAGTGL